MALRRLIILLSLLAFFSSPALAANDAGSEQRRFEDEALHKQMQEHLEAETVSREDLISFADEDPSAPSPKKSRPLESDTK